MKRILSIGIAAALGAQAASQGVPQLVWQIQAHENNRRVQDIAFSPDGSELVTGSEDKSIRVWRSLDGAPLRSVQGLSKPVGCVAWSPDGAWIASTSFVHEGVDQGDPVIRIWEADTLEPVAQLAGHTADVQQVAFSPDGSMLASAGRDGWVRLWRTSDWALVAAHSQPTWPFMDVKFSPDGTRIVTLDFAGDLKIFRAGDLGLIASIPTNMHSSFSSLAVSRSGALATGIAFNVLPWVSLKNLSVSAYSTTQITQSYAADFAPDGRTMLAAGLGGNQEIEVWQPGTRTLLRKWDAQSDNRFHIVFSLACRPRTNWFAYGNFYGQLFMARNPYAKFPVPLPTGN